MEWPSSDKYRGARFYDVSMAGALFREVDFTGARMRGVALIDVDIDADIANVVINGVDVVPHVLAELDRLEPERVLMRSDDPGDLRTAWAAIEAKWAVTTARIAELPDELRNRRVDDEWSAVETLRHLVFATDAWYGRAIAGNPLPYHPIGLPPTGMADQDAMGIDTASTPTFDEVLDARRSRQDMVRDLLATATATALQAPAPQVDGPGWPPPNPQRTVVRCLRVILDEELAHHRFCVRDLDALDAGERSDGPTPGGS